MAKFIINGPKKLKGMIEVAGCKNAALPIIAATLLTDEACVLENVPEIADVKVLLEIIKTIGAEVKKLKPNTYQIQTKKILNHKLPDDLVAKLRASILLMGPMLARHGKITILHPGGCFIGRRPVGVHFAALAKMGADITQDQLCYHAQAPKSGLRAAEIYLEEPSVTATENTILSAVLTPGTTTIKFSATEPHVQDLCRFLCQMGANISGIGTQTLTIQGNKKLSGANWQIIPDTIEIGTFASLAVATKSHLKIINISQSDLDPILFKLEKIGAKYKISQNSLEIFSTNNLKAAIYQTNPWPGFPTDLQAPFCVLATQCQGVSLVHDWMYERRLFYIDELVKMGANITLCDPHRALISGPSKLYGANIVSPDIRAGIALIIAALVAKGKTIINNVELIDRGYEKIEQRLNKLGAGIKREE